MRPRRRRDPAPAHGRTRNPRRYDAVAVGEPPVHSLKVKVVAADAPDGEPVAIVVVRAAAERVRVPEGRGKGRVEAGCSYVARVSRVSGVGAGPYSPPSSPATAAPPASSSRAPEPSRAESADGRGPRVHPKIARARAAMLAGREKRRKMAALVANQPARSVAVPAKGRVPPIEMENAAPAPAPSSRARARLLRRGGDTTDESEIDA